MKIFRQRNAKLEAAILGAIGSVLSQVYGANHWVLVATTLTTAFAVWLVPNAPKSTP